MSIIIKILSFPFFILYYLFGLITGKNNYYIVARNTANCYNILKSQNNNENIFNEKDIFFLSGVADAYYYLVRGQISLDDIYDASQENESLEDFLFDFIKLLMIIDAGHEAVAKGYFSYENRKKFKEFIRKGINDSKRYDVRYAKLVNQVLQLKDVMSYVDTELYDNLSDAIYNRG